MWILLERVGVLRRLYNEESTSKRTKKEDLIIINVY